MLEDENIESSEDFAKMLEDSFKEDNNKILKGVIIDIQEDEGKALIDIGRKVEGILNLQEILDKDGTCLFNKGDNIDVINIGNIGSNPKVSHNKVLEIQKTKEFINNNKDNYEDLILDATIKNKNKGGYVLLSDNINLFMPRSQAALKDNINNIGKEIKVKILKIDENKDGIIVSRKKLLNEKNKETKELIDSLMEDKKIIKGTIKKITSYGVFVDVGGVDGLVNYKEISHKGPVNPSKIYKEGDSVDVVAIAYDKIKKHLSLSIKEAKTNPWQEIQEKIGVGDVLRVKVSNMETYGVFVDLGNDIEALLHITEISWNKNIKHPKEIFEIGQEIDVEIISINLEEEKIRVSKKVLEPKPFDLFLKNYKENDIVKGTITSLVNFGAFVKIDNIEGLLHNKDINWDKNTKSEDVFKVGEEIEVKIVKINKDEQKITLSTKAFIESPIKKFSSKNKVGDIIKSKVKDIKDFGIFVSLEENLDALIRTEDIYPLNIENISKGQEIEAVISSIDIESNKIRLSVRRLEKKREQDALKEINSENFSTNNLGDIFKGKL